MHRHFFFEFGNIDQVDIPDFARVATKSAEVLIVADENMTVLCNSHITFDTLGSDHKSILESLKSVFWSFPTTASMCDNDLILTESRERLLKLVPTLVKQRGECQPQLAHKQVVNDGHQPVAFHYLPIDERESQTECAEGSFREH